ncbi:MAG: GMP reductase [Candidatus Nanoarchaeia archaeon]|nr:GMP reductase [Candidatus Nanoarchaeia archaeon]
MRIDNETKLDFEDILIRPKRSTLGSRKEVQLERTFSFIHSGRKWTGIPIITSNMDASGTFEMAKALSQHKMITALHKFYSIDQLKEFFKDFHNPDYVTYTLGIRDEDFEKLQKVLEAGLGDKFNFIVLDVPNAYLQRFVFKLEELRKLCPTHTIIAGNVVTNEMAEELILRGADIVKIGIGSGSVCTTRRKTGVGYPQISAIIECSDAAHGITNSKPGVGLIMADGGVVHTCDFGKAFCAGADFVMSGSLFSGYLQSGGEIIERNGKKFKQYYGMSSAKAQEKYYGGVFKHRASEGRYTEVPFKGDVNEFILDLFGSLRSTGTYIGARTLKEFSKRTTFILVNRQLNTSNEKYETKN